MQRRSSYIQAGAALIVWAVVVCAANACKAPDDTAPKTTGGNVGSSGGSGSGGSGGTGVVDNTAGFTVTLTGASAKKYILHDSSDTTTWTTNCKVLATATGNASNIFCTVEAPEADLYYQGLTMNFNVPTTMCTYLWVSPYGFYNQIVADGETQIIYWIDKNGSIGVDLTQDGIVDVPNQVYKAAGTPATKARFANGKLTCAYDNTAAIGGLNCCTGTYVQTVFAWDPSANAGAGAYKATTTQNLDWGGIPTVCYAGPFKDLAVKSTKDNVPESTVYYTDGIGINKAMDLTAPIEKGYNSNVYIANYINPADHGAPGAPASFFDPITSKPFPSANPYYDFGCMDEAFEYKARIRVDVRDWNTYTEWSKKGAGNSDVTGPESPPYTGAGNDDVLDWKDMETLLPGFAYPGYYL